MSESVLILIISLLCWGTLKTWFHKNSSPKLKTVPYGYKGIPGIGFLPNFKWVTCRRKLIQIRERYGKICKVRMGSFECIWLNDYQLIKDAWSNNKFCGRPDLVGISARTKNFRGGIIFNDGKDFHDQRRFVMHVLKTLGLGQGFCEQFILEEIQDLVATLAAHAGNPLSTRHIFNLSAFNIIWKVITGGSRFQQNDPVMSKLVEVLNRNMELNDGACAAFFMPWLSKFFPKFIGWNRYVTDAHHIFEFWVEFARTAVKNHKERQQPTDLCSSDLISNYCNKIERCTDPSSSFYDDKGVVSLATVLQDLFIAGSETTATTLQWICLYLGAFPECQQKAFQEIMSLLEETAGYGTPTVHVSDKIRLPYVQAFIKESLRYSTLAPLGMLHCTTDDVNFHGYFIPKGTLVQMNVAAVHFDKVHWKNPEEFQPERFLQDDKNSHKFKSTEIPGFLPFSSGKRICPGADVAEQTLFLALVHILQTFEIRNEFTHGLSKLEPKIGVSAVPSPHKLLFVKRKYNDNTKD